MAITKATASSIAPAVKGDLVAGSATNDAAVLAVGANGTVLTAASGQATGLEWATPSSGGMTSLASGSIAASGTGFDLTSISGIYNELWLYIINYSVSTSTDVIIRTNNNSSTDYSFSFTKTDSGTVSFTQGESRFIIQATVSASEVGLSAVIRFPNYANTTGFKNCQWQASKNDNELRSGNGFTKSVSAISRITFSTTGGTFDAGTYELFGVK